jgi:hypothetical protein
VWADVSSEEAELAAGDAMEVLAQFRSAEAHSRSRTRPRLGGPWSIGGYSSRYGAVVAITSVVEQFAVLASRRRLRRTLGDSPRLVADALAEFERRVESKWDERTQGWRRWFGIDYRLSPDFVALLAFVEARNAIVHGAGRLTRLQLSSDRGVAVTAKLKAVGLEFSDGQLIVAPAAVERAAHSARNAIYWIDNQLAEASDQT